MNRLFAAGVVAAGLSGACSFGGEKGGEQVPAALSDRIGQIETEQNMTNLTNVFEEPYVSKGEVHVGNLVIQLATLGEVSKDVLPAVEFFQQVADVIQDVVETDPNTSVTFFNKDNQNDERQINFGMKLREGDAYSVIAEGDIKISDDFGTLADNLTSFVNYGSEPVVGMTVTDSNGLLDPNQVLTNVCMTMLDAEITNASEVGAESEQLDDMVQDNVCTALGSAIAAASMNVPYEEYRNAMEEFAGNAPTFGIDQSNSYFVSYGFIGEDLYNNLLAAEGGSLDGQILYPSPQTNQPAHAVLI